ncbi:MAG TPA: hypothetical protein VF346_07125 [Bacteroidales bacterium]
MKRILLIVISFFFIIHSGICQKNANSGIRILFHGMVLDSKTLSPVPNSQILINHEFSAVSSSNGNFAFFVNMNDTVLFKHLGYKPTFMFVADTLTGQEFIAGVYLNSDTLEIGEVVILPRFRNIKSDVLNARTKTSPQMENARYNVAISAYQGRTTQGKLGDPASNYQVLHERQKIDAFERGGIPSDRIVGFSSLLILPAAYLLIHGSIEKPPAFEQELTDQEIELIREKYLETLKQSK